MGICGCARDSGIIVPWIYWVASLIARKPVFSNETRVRIARDMARSFD